MRYFAPGKGLGHPVDMILGAETWMREIRQAGRSLLRRKGLLAAALASLALGVGANTAIFSVLDAVVLRPLPVRDGERVFVVQEKRDGQETGGNPQRLYDWMAQIPSVEAAAGYYTEQLVVGGGREPQQVTVARTFGKYFQATGVDPAVGRGFGNEEFRGKGEAVAVLSTRLARRLFGDAPRAVGRTVELNRMQMMVIGVMAPEAGLPDAADAWVPAEASMQGGSRKAAFLFTFARLRGGLAVSEAAAEWKVVEKRLAAQYPDSDRGLEARLAPLQQAAGAAAREPLLLLLLIAAFVLLIACLNIATLLLSRATERQQEASIRKALGGSGWVLVRLYLTEALMLSLAGGVLGACAALFVVDVLKVALPAELPRLESAVVDGRMLLFCLGVSLLCGLVFGAGPAWYAARSPMRPLMGRALRRPWLSGALVVGEVAAALLLLSGAGAVMDAFLRLRQAPLGFAPDQLLTVKVSQPWNTPQAKLNQFHAAALEQLAAIAGVRAVGLTDRLPLQGGTQSQTVRIAGVQLAPELAARRVSLRGVSAGYFAAMGVPSLVGTVLGRRGEAVVNEVFWKTYLEGTDAVGREVTMDGGTRVRIVGVVGNIRQDTLTETPPEVFVLMEEVYWPLSHFVLRAQGDAGQLRAAVRERIRQVDARLWIDEMRTMEETVGEAWSTPKLVARMMGGFALLALLLAAIGIHGVVASEVAQRRKEMGIRAALGADRGRIVREVVGRGLRLAWMGGAVGAVLCVWGFPLLRMLPVGVGEMRLGPLVGAGLVLVGAAMGASYWPARRAASIDPVVVLRCE